MALIDVTELLVDPDFVDDMSVITRYPLVNSLGENIFKETILESVGSIQAVTGDAVNKIPELMRSENVSSFWFKGEIVTTIDCKYSSIIVFEGKRYQVRHVFDWTNWGQGWCEGLCVREIPAA